MHELLVLYDLFIVLLQFIGGITLAVVAEGQWFNLRTGTLEDRDRLLELIK